MKNNGWKIGIGAGAILLGVYLMFNNLGVAESVIGIIFIAFGIGLIAASN